MLPVDSGSTSVHIDRGWDGTLRHRPDATFDSLLDSCGWVLGATGCRHFSHVDLGSRSMS